MSRQASRQESPQEIVDGWRSLGGRRRLLGRDIFVVDVPATAVSEEPPLLVLHGFPTSSVDFSAVLAALRRLRRVVLFDFLGFGFSEKPDQPYSLFEQADLVEALAADLGLARVDLLTHDMGDSVGGEVLARSLDGDLGFEIGRRVVTNGSIYIDMAQLTDGQQLLLGLPDEKLADSLGFDVAAITGALEQTLSPSAEIGLPHLAAAAELVCADDGVRLLPRIIRYIEERRRHETRWTTAIEQHPAPLTVVWGVDDPIAVVGMAHLLMERAPEASFLPLGGVGHYPMVEAPERFATAVLAGLE